MTAQRLPGVYFETIVPPVPEPLPRMDIAAFVGFAASGPLNVPVAVEDAARFEEIFGQDQQLAWDPVGGELVYAQLPPSVRAFFRNGGERCWIVRVADDAAATANQFAVPGMLRSDPGVPYQAAWLWARSEGSWSDDLMVNATLSFLPLESATPTKTANGISVALQASSANMVSPGDLLQLAFDGPQGSPPSGAGRVLFLPVTAVSNGGATTAIASPQAVTVVSADKGYWFQTPAMEDFSLLNPSSPPSLSATGVQWLVTPAGISSLAQPQEMDLTVNGWGIEVGTNPLQFVVEVPRTQADNVTSGSWLRVTFTGGNLPTVATELLLLVDSVRGSTAAAPAVFSPASDQEPAQIISRSAWWVLDDQAAWSAHLAPGRADVVTLELWVRDGSGRITTLSNLGLSSLHSEYLGYMPSDAQLFMQSNQPSTPPGSALRAVVDHPRFPLAFPSSDFSVTDAAPPNVYPFPVLLPLGVTGIVDETFYQPAAPQTGLPLERDGLALASNGQLSADLFLDPDLSGSNINTLLTEAFHKQFQLQREDNPGPAGEPLLKIHAVLPLDEVSMIALPDATHLGWTQAINGQDLLGAPDLVHISVPAPDGSITLSWTPVDQATSYTLQESSDPQFATATVAWEGTGQPAAGSPSLVQSGPIPATDDCPSLRYFRVLAKQGAVAGPWSNTLSRSLPPESFQQCFSTALAAPVMAVPLASRGRVVLAWLAPPVGALSAGTLNFQLQAAYEPDFVLPTVIYSGTDLQFEVWSDPSRTVYFRVAAADAVSNGPWSNTVVVQSDQAYSRFEMNVPSTAADALQSIQSYLLTIHQAMLRLCAARGDVFAWMSLPQAFDTDASVLYRNQLTALMDPEDGDRTLSFGAIYFPWLTVLDTSDGQPGSIRSISPEGAISGSAAALTLSSGAWFSPAKQILKGVVDLDPKLPDTAPEIFFTNQLNLVMQEAPGFLAMSSFTLSSAVQMQEINVRRLVILLRRLALREGVDYVFQSNDSSLWRIARRRFEEILRELFLQGAFAGATQDESFQVRTDSSVNTQETIDQGQFIVELSIAPSLPMEFLTVRLLQTGGDLTLSEQP